MPVRSVTFSLALASLLAMLLSSCGGSSSSSTRKSATATASTVSNPRPPAAQLRILSPHADARTGPTVVIRVKVTGAGSPGRRALVYQLDHHRAQRSGERLVLHHVAPGHHHLLIRLENGAQARAVVPFTVRAPAPVAPVATATSTATFTTPTAAAPPTTTTAPPAPTTTSAPPPTTTPAPAPPPKSAIPQNNGGDQDADNNGGPTDGDGNI